jgi:hypothetical protein
VNARFTPAARVLLRPWGRPSVGFGRAGAHGWLRRGVTDGRAEHRPGAGISSERPRRGPTDRRPPVVYNAGGRWHPTRGKRTPAAPFRTPRSAHPRAPGQRLQVTCRPNRLSPAPGAPESPPTPGSRSNARAARTRAGATRAGNRRWRRATAAGVRPAGSRPGRGCAPVGSNGRGRDAGLRRCFAPPRHPRGAPNGRPGGDAEVGRCVRCPHRDRVPRARHERMPHPVLVADERHALRVRRNVRGSADRLVHAPGRRPRRARG